VFRYEYLDATYLTDRKVESLNYLLMKNKTAFLACVCQTDIQTDGFAVAAVTALYLASNATWCKNDALSYI